MPKYDFTHLLGGHIPLLWDRLMWLSPGYGHLTFKASFCWEQHNRTKMNLPNDIHHFALQLVESCTSIANFKTSD
jgi:hypothetical protein